MGNMSVLASAAILGFLALAPVELQRSITELVSSAPYLSVSTTIRLVKAITGFVIVKAIASRANAYFSWKAENNWATDDKYDWEKEVLLLTGASSGLGEQMAQMLADRGVKVVALDVQPLKPEIAAYKNVHFYECDVGNFNRLSEVAAQIRADHGDPTVLVLNAAIINDDVLLNIPVERTQKLLNINLVSHFAMVHEFLPSMIEKNHGHIVQVASMCSFITISGLSDYSVSKAGVLALHESLRQELRHVYKADKVRTSIVHPTWMKTNIVEFSESIKSRNLAFASVSRSARQVVDAIMGGYSQRVLVPQRLGMQVGVMVRGLPFWFQEPIRDRLKIRG
ncbi:hypothetical protein DRE_00167 [Drechslerella stenobrocha 248]|uniref:Short-chain dehydrogenase/reductase 3 n=1 Tax=Drechslerella stenobrocha 248 TaxID=1043628 RepID=W7I9T9_9PEZI|nr:hypothetical protein DRE_00167 [Drechslerella stenobrocha 248]